MTPAPVTLDYAQPAPRWQQRFSSRALAVVAGMLLLLLASPRVPFSRSEVRIDPVTGSVTRHTVWPLGLSAGTPVEVSPLETRLTRSGIPWTRALRTLTAADRNIFGGVTRRGCNSAPPIYRLRPMLADFADTATDAEVTAFVRVMESGTDAEQAAAVDVVDERIFSTWPCGIPMR